MKIFTALLCQGALLLFSTTAVMAHCEIPCGIYGDEARFVQIAEDITTIEKAMKMITQLSAAKPVDHNQLVRWINSKETHAKKIQQVVAQYFMAQRIAPPDAKTGTAAYAEKLILLHGLLRSAMHAKQTTDPKVCARLRSLLALFKKAYTAK